MNTPCGQYLVKWLTATKLFKAQGAPSAQMLAVKKMLYELWFELYHRGGGGRADDSCAFEHVFVGEIGQTKDRTGKEVKGSKLHTSSLRSVAFGSVCLTDIVDTFGLQCTTGSTSMLRKRRESWITRDTSSRGAVAGAVGESDRLLVCSCSGLLFSLTDLGDRSGIRDDNSEEQVHTLQFEWHGVYKEMGTSIIGASPGPVFPLFFCDFQ